MDPLTQELIAELDAWHPHWRTIHPTLTAAAHAAGLQALYEQWAATDAGRAYLERYSKVPDHVGDSRRRAAAERQQPRSLPFGYSNIGMIPDGYWSDDQGEEE